MLSVRYDIIRLIPLRSDTGLNIRIFRSRARARKAKNFGSPEILSDHIRVDFHRKRMQARRDSLPPHKDMTAPLERAVEPSGHAGVFSLAVNRHGESNYGQSIRACGTRLHRYRQVEVVLSVAVRLAAERGGHGRRHDLHDDQCW